MFQIWSCCQKLYSQWISLCSICSVPGHHYKACTATSPKYALCKGNHNATSPQRPQRKDQIKIILATNKARTDASKNSQSPSCLNPHKLATAVILKDPITSPPLLDNHVYVPNVPQHHNPVIEQHGILNPTTLTWGPSHPTLKCYCARWVARPRG